MVKNLDVAAEKSNSRRAHDPGLPAERTIDADCKKALAAVGIKDLEISFGAQGRGSKSGAGQTDCCRQ